MTASISAPAPDPRAPAGRQRFRHAARMEWIKLRSLRYPAWTLLLAVAGTAAAGAAAGFNTKNLPATRPTTSSPASPSARSRSACWACSR